MAAEKPRMNRRQVRVVLLDADEPLTLQVVQALAQVARFRLVAVGFSAANAFRYSRLCRYVHVANWRWELGPRQLDDLARRWPGAILFPVSLAAVGWMSTHRSTLLASWRLPPLPRSDVLELVCDKVSFTELVQRYGGDVPLFRRLPAGGAGNLGGLSFPALLKPRRRTGGAGIERVDTPEALCRRLRSLPVPEDYFVQSFVPGEDLSCGVLCRNGRLLVAVVYAGLARLGEFGAFSSIALVDDPGALEAVGGLMRTLGWDGLANVDLRRSVSGRTYLLEVNPRVWGNLLGTLVSGVNFADLMCRSALGEGLPPIAPSRQGRFFSIRDSVALLGERLRNGRGAGARAPSWRESGLRFLCRDPLPYWIMHRQREGRHNPLAVLRNWARQAAPRTGTGSEMSPGEATVSGGRAPSTRAPTVVG